MIIKNKVVSIETSGEPIGSGRDNLGREIDIFWLQNMERENRGFIADEATAWHGNECLGYLRMQYIDPEAYERFNPTIWNHFDNFAGGCGLMGLHPADVDKPRKFYERMLLRMKAGNDKQAKSYEDFMSIVTKTKSYEDLLSKKQKMLDFHLNKPHVSFSSLEPSPDRNIKGTDVGLGVGKILYAGAAIALSKSGLSFYASGLQSDEAQKLWRSMRKKGWTKPIIEGVQDREELLADRIPLDFLKTQELTELSM